MSRAKLITLLVLAGIVLLHIFMNIQPAKVWIFWINLEMPSFMLICGTFILGGVIGALLVPGGKAKVKIPSPAKPARDDDETPEDRPAP